MDRIAIYHVFLAAISLTLMGEVTGGSNVRLVSEGSYGIALPVTGPRIEPCAPFTRLMSMRLAGSLVALTLAATAAEGQPLRLLPPPDFDHLYAGKLDVVVARDQNHVRQLCPNAVFGVTLGALACSLVYGPDSCTIIMAPEAIKAAGLPMDIIFRHEQAHCNGWPGDHKGALPYEEWATELAPGGISKKIRTVPVPGGTATFPMAGRPYPEAQEPAGRMPAWRCGIAIQIPCD